MMNSKSYKVVIFCSKFDVRPSVDDLRNHRSLIKQFVEKDPTLAKSEVHVLFVSWTICMV